MQIDRLKASEISGHLLEVHSDEDGGGVNIWAHDEPSGWHNGPRCVRCDASWCYGCEPIGPRWGCQARGFNLRNATAWLAFRVAFKARKAALAAWREVTK